MKKNERFDNYVYLAFDPRKPGKYSYTWGDKTFDFEYQPFYVGRGVDRRMMSHMEPAARRKDCLKNSIITRIEGAGLSPIFRKLFEGLTYEESEEIEIIIIKHFGRRDIGTGSLANRTDGGNHIGFIPPPYKKRDPNSPLLSSKSQRLDQFDLNGNWIRKWDSPIEAARSLGLKNSSTISAAAKGKISKSKGFIWKYDGTYPRPAIFKTKSYPTQEVFQYKDGVFLEKFESIDIAAEKTGSNARSISSCANGNRPRTNGYQWFKEYQGENAPIPTVSRTNGRKTVLQFDLDRNLVKTYESLKVALEETGFSKSTINGGINSGRPYRGFYWEYASL